MPDAPVLVCGATGFLGRRVVDRLLAQGAAVRALAREPAAARLPGAVAVVGGDLTDPESLAAACAGARAVVSAAAVTADRPPPAGGYDAVNVRGVAALGRAAAAAGVERIVHVAGLGGPAAAGPYLAGRRRGVEALRAAGVPLVVVRPALMFGPGSAFVATIARLARLPIVPVIGSPAVRVQLVHVDDAARCVVDCLDGRRPAPAELEVAGPEALTMAAIVRIVAAARGRRRPPMVVGAPVALGRLAARLPGSPLTPAALELVGVDNVAAGADVVERELGFAPRSFVQHVATHGLEIGKEHDGT